MVIVWKTICCRVFVLPVVYDGTLFIYFAKKQLFLKKFFKISLSSRKTGSLKQRPMLLPFDVITRKNKAIYNLYHRKLSHRFSSITSN